MRHVSILIWMSSIMSILWVFHSIPQLYWTYEWVLLYISMSHMNIWMSSIIHINESYEWNMTIPHINASWHTYQWVTSHTPHAYMGTHVMTHVMSSVEHTLNKWLRHGTHMNESRHGTHMNESRHVAHMNESRHVAYMNESCHSCGNGPSPNCHTWDDICWTHESEACRTLIAALLPHHMYSPNPSPPLTTDLIHLLYWHLRHNPSHLNLIHHMYWPNPSPLLTSIDLIYFIST